MFLSFCPFLSLSLVSDMSCLRVKWVIVFREGTSFSSSSFFQKVQPIKILTLLISSVYLQTGLCVSPWGTKARVHLSIKEKLSIWSGYLSDKHSNIPKVLDSQELFLFAFLFLLFLFGRADSSTQLWCFLAASPAQLLEVWILSVQKPVIKSPSNRTSDHVNILNFLYLVNTLPE